MLVRLGPDVAKPENFRGWSLSEFDELELIGQVRLEA
jgi:hypothetical protein